MRRLAEKNLRWACRRGMLELDLLLLPFFDEKFSSLSSEEKLHFQALLSEADQDIYSWILRVVPCQEKKYQKIIEKIQNYNGVVE